jgi:hypothetical protein
MRRPYGTSINQSLRHWTNANYVGSLPNALFEQLKKWVGRKKYAAFMPVMNSSGVGKSRCINELGTKGPLVVNLVLRSGNDAGYPPGDPELYDFLGKIKSVEQFWQANVLALSFVLGTFMAGMLTRDFIFLILANTSLLQ